VEPVAEVDVKNVARCVERVVEGNSLYNDARCVTATRRGERIEVIIALR
jgi:hypothetical protein